MQDDLFADAGGQPPPTPAKPKKAAGEVRPQAADPADQALAAALPRNIRLGTSSWTYPGWNGQVWDGDYADATLSKHGLQAYAQHPLLRAVSLDRAFYRPLSAVQYARYAAQVPDDFRFVVKAPSMVSDALVRNENGQGMQANPLFLNPDCALQEFVLPALDGLGHKLGALVFQLSPLPAHLLADLPGVLQKLQAMLSALPPLQAQAPDGVVAVEVRDPQFVLKESPVMDAFAAVLREAGATYCLGLHAKMPPIAGQLPLLRKLWPGPLVCRWNLNPLHGAYGYEEARALYEPYDKLVDPDEATREVLVKVATATARQGENVFVTVSNKAEGCAPQSVRALAGLLQNALAAPASTG
ncbi:MAG: DUF72 domain-containing protein [Pseudomonadota bacterium]